MKITKPLIEVAKKYNYLLSNCTFYQLKMSSEINLNRKSYISIILRCEAVQGVSYTTCSNLCFYSEYASDCYGGNPLLPHLPIIACMFLKLLMFYFN